MNTLFQFTGFHLPAALRFRLLLILSLGLLLLAGLPAARQAWASPEVGELAQWEFDGNLNDASGNSYNLSLQGNVTYSEGCFGQGVHFPNDANAFLTRGGDDNTFDFGSSNYSVELWLQFDQTPNTSHEQTLIEKCSGAQCTGEGWSITVMSNNVIRFINNPGYHTFVDSPAIPFQTGRWYHLAAVREGAVASIYLDGELIASGAVSDPVNTGNPVILGRRFDNSQQLPLIGSLDRVAAWTRALTPAEIQTHFEAGAGCNAVVPLKIFVYDDYEEDSYGGSLREYLEGRGHLVTYSHDSVGLIDVWNTYQNYDVILAIHTTGGGTLTNLQPWFQNGKGYVAMLGGGMWDDDKDVYIRNLLGSLGGITWGAGWTPDQLTWADPAHPIAQGPNTSWPITGVPFGQEQITLNLINGHTVVAAPQGAVLQTIDNVEGSGRIAVWGSNYHGSDRTDPEARYLVENMLEWASTPYPAVWFNPSVNELRAASGSVITYSLELVNRSGAADSFDLALTSNWSAQIVNASGDPITTLGPLDINSRGNVYVRVTLPAGLPAYAADTATLEAVSQTNGSLRTTTNLHTLGPEAARYVDVVENNFNLPASGTTNIIVRARDRYNLPVADGTVLDISILSSSSITLSTSGGQASFVYTAPGSCTLDEIRAETPNGAWGVTYISGGTTGPVDIYTTNITGTTTWTACGGPYLIHNDLWVNPGATLTLEAGTQVRFDGWAGLFIQGNLDVQGAAGAPVVFSANGSDPSMGFWRGIVLGDDTYIPNASFSNSVVAFAGGVDPNGAAVRIKKGEPLIHDSLFYRNRGDAINAESAARPDILNNTFLYNDGGITVQTNNWQMVDHPIPAGFQAEVWWRYTAFTAPPAGWNTNLGFDDSGWSVGRTPICDNPGCNTYLELNGSLMYARKIITPTLGTSYYVRAGRDDMVSIWVNGALVYTDTQGGGSQWTQYIPITLNPGQNLIAAMMNDSGGGGNYFDLEVDGGSQQRAAIQSNLFRSNGLSGWPAVNAWDSSPAIDNNVFFLNQANAIQVGGDSSPSVRNNLVYWNEQNGYQGSLGSMGGWPEIINNTFDSNAGFGLNFQNNWGDQPIILNNLVTNNGGGGINCINTRSWNMAYNDAYANSGQGNYVNCWTLDPSNTQREPGYLDIGNGDYHLQAGAPPIDAGDPNPVYNDLNGTRNDLGAFGGPGGESYTYQDNRGPFVENIAITPSTLRPSEAFIITAKVWDTSGVASVFARIGTPEPATVDVTLFDDGAHNDGAAGDGVYGSTWANPGDEGGYSLELHAIDSASRESVYGTPGFTVRTPLTLVVTSTADAGPGTLRQALNDAQPYDTITFDPAVFPPATGASIAVLSPLPELNRGNLTIDGRGARVTLNGCGPVCGSAFNVVSDYNVIMGLRLQNFGGDGIYIRASYNQIGGPDAAMRNVIGSMGQTGIRIEIGHDNVVQNNWIGMDASGTQAMPNRETGIALYNGANHNVIGSAGAGNTIFASEGDGLRLKNSNVAYNTIAYNVVGLPAVGAPRLAYAAGLALSPNYATDCTLYVATLNDAVEKSTDCGASFAPANAGISEQRLIYVGIPRDAANAQTVYALSESGTFYITSNGGAGWTVVSNAFQMFDKRNLAFSPAFITDHTLYASAEWWSWWELGGNPGVFKSTDGGATWANSSNGMTNTNVHWVAVSPDPAEKNTLFALTQGPVQKSTDGGATWFEVVTPGGGGWLTEIALSPNFHTDQTVIIVGDGGRVYRSTDGGSSWTQIDIWRNDPRHLVFSPNFAVDQTVCTGFGWNDEVACSTDGGATWQQHFTSLPGPTSWDGSSSLVFSPDFASDQTLYVSSSTGLARSTDAAQNWQVLRSFHEYGNNAGVSLQDGAHHNDIGPGNVIGNNTFAVTFDSDNTSFNHVFGNLVGLYPDGVTLASNSDQGIDVRAGHDNLIGGSTPAERNVVVNPFGYSGIFVRGWNVYNNVVSGNWVGLNAAGQPVGVQNSGIEIAEGAHDNRIGGPTAGERNVIVSSGSGVSLRQQSHHNLVQGNWIGLDPNGNPLGNRNGGVEINNQASYNTIDSNVIVASGWNGVSIWENGTVSNTVSNNFIGTDPTGTLALGNNGSGVMINNGAAFNHIANNVISSNRDIGVGLQDWNTTSNVVAGNLIGVNASGMAALPNNGDGIRLSNGTHDNIIGGPAPADRNLISGNYGSGISIVDGGTNGNVVAGNWIGVDVSGIQPLPNLAVVSQTAATVAQRTYPPDLTLDDPTSRNSPLTQASAAQLAKTLNPAGTQSPERSNDGAGVFIAWGASDNIIGPNNLIAFNSKDGVHVESGNSLRNTITQNSLFYNAGPGIFLRDGGNNGIEAPRIASVNLAGGLVSGTSVPNAVIEVFSAIDEEGKIYEGTTTADGSGSWSLSAGHALTGPNVTATATDVDGNTSPFSQLFNLLVFDLNVPQTLDTLKNLGVTYTLVNAADFATVNLNDYDVLFVGFTGNDPQPDNLLQPLLDRRADIAAFVQNGGALVANSEDGVVATPLDWLWTPVTVTHRNSGGNNMLIADPSHLLVQGLTDADLLDWWPFHNVFTAWDWPEAAVVLREPIYGEPVVLAGSYGSGRMVLSGSDPDYHDAKGAMQLLYNELTWAAGVMVDTPPQVITAKPWAGYATADRAVVTFGFNQLVDPATVSAATVQVEGSASGVVSGLVRYYPDNAQGEFVPAAPFVVGERVTVTLSAAISDLTGHGLDGNGDYISQGAPTDNYIWSFTVRAGATLIVNNTGDEGLPQSGGVLTLRQALEMAQAGDIITFDPAVFPPAAPATISPQAGLPWLWQGYLTLDASSAGVILDGSTVGGRGLNISSEGNVIRGLRIHNYPHTAIFIEGGYNLVGGAIPTERNILSGNGNGVIITGAAARNNLISGNYLGLETSGAPQPNYGQGVMIVGLASYNRIGGSTPGERNIISGNSDRGIYIEDGSYNLITGNYIGTDVTGMAAIGNGSAGIEILDGSHHNQVGGATSGERNLISGNRWHGVNLTNTSDNTIIGNYVGVDATGNGPLGNQGHGIASRWGSLRNIVGGSAPGEGNVASANAAYGIRFWDAAQCQIINNLVGMGADGVTPLGNSMLGIGVFYAKQMTVEGNVIGNSDLGVWLIGVTNSTVRANQIGVNAVGGAAPIGSIGLLISSDNSQNNLLGGPTPADGNLITNSGGNGVEIWNDGGSTFANTFSHNAIYANAALGLDLRNGANNNIVAPVVTASNPAGGTASGTACSGCTVEVFSDLEDEGQWFEGSVIADGGGSWSLTAGHAFTGSSVQATATDGAGNTSEFSGPPPTVNGVSPNEATPGVIDLAVWINGSNFRDNAPLSVDFGPGVFVTGVEFQNSEKIKVYINIDSGAVLGPRDVTVTNYDDQSGMLAGGFTVVNVPPPPPLVTGVSPAAVAPDVSGSIIVVGSGFIDRPAVVITPTGVTVVLVEFNEPEKLKVNIIVAPDAALGPRTITVINPDGQSSTLPDAFEVVAAQFEPVAQAAGVAPDNTQTTSASWPDFNGDGMLDLFAAGSPTYLFRNEGTLPFADMSAAAGVAAVSGWPAAAWADVDNDGDLDVALAGFDGSTTQHFLYINNGDGTFTEAGDAWNFVFDGDPEGIAWADYNRDGNVDLFVARVGSPSLLFRNDIVMTGGQQPTAHTFTEVAAAAGVASPLAGGSGVAWSDYDADGWPDLFALGYGDFHLYHNNGDGTFTDIADTAGIAGNGECSPAWADYDNDGDLDLFVGCMSASVPGYLFRNNGDGTFTDVRDIAGLSMLNQNRPVAWGDYDNDGWLDLYVAEPFGQEVLYHNEGIDALHPTVTFSNGSLAARLGSGYGYTGAAWGDYDGDGWLDLFIGDEGTPNLLYHNQLAGSGNHWLQVKLFGTLSNVSGIGARVRVVAGGLSMIREISGGSGFYSQDSLPAEFGLGTYTGTVTVEVYWPSGQLDLLNVASDQMLTVTESTGRLHDLEMTDVLPAGSTPVDLPLTPAATLRNMGQFVETNVPVNCEISLAGSVLYSETVSLAVIDPALWEQVIFPPFTPTMGGEYALTCTALLPVDENPANDQQTVTFLVTEQIADSWSKDDPQDNGDVPSSWQNWYMSPDLWVRNQDDGGLNHQDPIASITNTVYVRLRNRGNTPVYSGTVSVYWIEPSLGVRCGGWAPIGEIAFVDLQPGEVRILSLPWVPTRTGHTCMQDVIDSAQDPFNRALECAPQWVPWDNNVVWHNVNILASPGYSGEASQRPTDVKTAEVQMVNIYDRPMDVDLIVDRQSFPMTGTITIQLPADLFDRWWSYGGKQLENISVNPETREIVVTGAVSGTIGSVPMTADEQVTVGLRFEGPAGLEFEMAIRERIAGIVTGGVAYQWRIPDTTPPAITGYTPAAGATNVPLDAPIVLQFSEPVGPLSFSFTVTNDPGGWRLVWDETNTQVTLFHDAFVEGQDYTITVNVNDGAGNPLPEFQWSFQAMASVRKVYLPVVFNRR